MKPKDIITLDNDITYLVVEEYEYKNDKFYLSVGIDNENDLDPDNIVMLYNGEDEEGEFVEIVEDKNVLKELYGMILVDFAVESNPDIKEELIKEIEKKLAEEGSN